MSRIHRELEAGWYHMAQRTLSVRNALADRCLAPQSQRLFSFTMLRGVMLSISVIQPCIAGLVR